MNDIVLLSDVRVQQIGWTLVHALWQGVLIAGALAAVRAIVKDSRVRYAASCLALLAMVALPPATVVSRGPASAVAVPPSMAPVSQVVDTGSTNEPAARAARGGPPESVRPPAASADRWVSIAAALQDRMPIIVRVWLAGVFLLSLRLIGGCWATRRLKRVGTQRLPTQWRERVRADALAKLEGSRGPALASAAVGGAALVSRIRRLLSREHRKTRKPSGVLPGLVGAALVVTVLALALESAPSAKEEPVSDTNPSRKILDVQNTPVWTRIVSALHGMLQAAGETGWTPENIRGVLGNPFSFEMREGGGKVWQEGNLDWGLVFESRPERQFGQIRRFQARQGDQVSDIEREKAEAWKAVRASIGRGVPAVAWCPMNGEPDAARDWGMLVGYDEAAETYVIRRRGGEFEVGYDAIGHSAPEETFCVLVYEGPGDADPQQVHLDALRNAVAFANGTRYDTAADRFDIDARGFDAFELWRQALASGTGVPESQRHPRSDGLADDASWHAGDLAALRGQAASYLRGLVDVFPSAASRLRGAAGYYDRVVEMANTLQRLCDRTEVAGGFTAETRIEASNLIAGAMQNDMAAVAAIESAIRAIDPGSSATRNAGPPRTAPSSTGRSRADLGIRAGEESGSLISVLPPVMRAAGREWSKDFLRGFLGLAFVFSMREDGGSLWHEETYEWSHFWQRLPDLRVIDASMSGKYAVTPEIHTAKKVEAWDAVRKSIDAGIPAIVWAAMTNETKDAGPPWPHMWGLIVGYDDAAGTYTVHHPDTGVFTIGWDAFGHSDSAKWFCVMLIEPGSKPFDPAEAHRVVLERAVEAAKGMRPANVSHATAHGLDAWEMWLDALRSGSASTHDMPSHAWFLRTSRHSAAVYLRDVQSHFPAPAHAPIQEAASHYDRIADAMKQMLDLRDANGAFNQSAAADILEQALTHERAAVAALTTIAKTK